MKISYCPDPIAYRNKLLQDTDWTQVPDSPVDKEAYQRYRQALRDITDQPGYPDNIEWPQLENYVLIKK